MEDDIITNNANKMSFWEHLDELRGRIITSIIAILISAIFTYFFLDKIITLLLEPVGQVIFLSPTEAFVMRLKLAFFSGLFLALPVLLYQFWKFVLPALYNNEDSLLKKIIMFSYVLFLTGVFFAYKLVLPAAMKFLMGFSSELIKPGITFRNYCSFVVNFLLGFGLMFQMPLAVFILVKTKVVSSDFFSKNRKYAIVIIFIIAAVLTPGPDIFSQVMVALPTLILYELSVYASKLSLKK